MAEAVADGIALIMAEAVIDGTAFAVGAPEAIAEPDAGVESPQPARAPPATKTKEMEKAQFRRMIVIPCPLKQGLPVRPGGCSLPPDGRPGPLFGCVCLAP